LKNILGSSIRIAAALSLGALALSAAPALGVGGGVERYCPSNPNSTGAPATIDLSGSRSVSLNDTHLLARDCPPLHPAVFICGVAPAALPLGGGMLCISPFAPGIHRVATALFVQPDGTLDCPLDIQAMPVGNAITAGSVWYFQVLFRDHEPGGPAANLSDAIAVTFLP
jgi:hypothetical protein